MLSRSTRLRILLKTYLDRSSANETERREQFGLLKAEATKTEGAIQRLLNLVAEGVMNASGPMLKDRLGACQAQLTAQRNGIHALEGRARPPRKAIADSAIERFAAAMRTQLKDGDTALRRAYLRIFVERTEIDDREIRMTDPKSALAKALVEPLPAPTTVVPSLVQEWRAVVDVSENCWGLAARLS